MAPMTSGVWRSGRSTTGSDEGHIEKRGSRSPRATTIHNGASLLMKQASGAPTENFLVDALKRVRVRRSHRHCRLQGGWRANMLRKLSPAPGCRRPTILAKYHAQGFLGSRRPSEKRSDGALIAALTQAGSLRLDRFVTALGMFSHGEGRMPGCGVPHALPAERLQEARGPILARAGGFFRPPNSTKVSPEI